MNNRVWLLLLTMMTASLVLWTVYSSVTKPKLAYVNINKLHEGYQLKRQLEGRLESRLALIKHAIDSLQLVHRLKAGEGSISAVDSNIARLNYELQRSYEAGTNELSVEVWNRLNPLIEKFGSQKHYAIVIGANGTGSLMYADPSYDITEELIKFVNGKAND